MDQLSFVRWIKRFAGFQFDEDNAADYQISIVRSYCLPMKPNRDRNLSLEIDPAFFQSHSHCFFINFFKKSEPEFVVDVVKDTNDLLGQF